MLFRSRDVREMEGEREGLLERWKERERDVREMEGERERDVREGPRRLGGNLLD